MKPIQNQKDFVLFCMGLFFCWVLITLFSFVLFAFGTIGLPCLVLVFFVSTVILIVLIFCVFLFACKQRAKNDGENVFCSVERIEADIPEKEGTENSAQNYLKKMRECIVSLDQTTDPKTFFKRYETAVRNVELAVEQLRGEEKIDAQTLLSSLLHDKENFIYDFIQRCYRKGVLDRVKGDILENREHLTYDVLDYMDGLLECGLDREEVLQMNLSVLDGMDGREFEKFCAELLKKNDYEHISVTRGSGDQGVDILAEKEGVKYAIQCKNYWSPLSNKPVQEVNAGKAFYRCHVGVVMTNSTFTSGAEELSRATGVLLWDRSALQKMIENEV